MAAVFWAKLHGATTHFPIVLTFVAFACDLAANVWWTKPQARGLSVAGAGAIVLAGLGSMAAVISGLFLARGEIWGTGNLGWHHRFVWPALGLTVGAATWRWCAHNSLTRKKLTVYLAFVLVAAILVSTAGYFGGELLLAAP